MRHPCTKTGRMTRIGEATAGWRMYCDNRGCAESTETRPTQGDFPLPVMAAAGWLCGRKCDLCPSCRAAGQTLLERGDEPDPSTLTVVRVGGEAS